MAAEYPDCLRHTSSKKQSLTSPTPPESAIEITVRPVLSDSARRHLEAAEQLRETAQEPNARSAAEVRAAAKELKASRLTLRDIGAVMDISHQRTHQLVNS